MAGRYLDGYNDGLAGKSPPRVNLTEHYQAGRLAGALERLVRVIDQVDKRLYEQAVSEARTRAEAKGPHVQVMPLGRDSIVSD